MHAVQLVDDYLEWLGQEVALCQDPEERESRAATLAYYECQLGKLRTVLPKDLPVEELKPYHLDKSPDRRKRHFLQATKRVFKWAFDTERIPTYPLRGVKLPRQRGRKRTLTAAEFEAILRESPPFMQEFLWVMLRTGARPRELRELRWNQVRFEERIFRIEKFKAMRLRQDDLPARDIPFDTEILEMLQQRRRRQQSLPGMSDPNGYVFLGQRGQPLSGDRVGKNFARACRKAKIDQSGERAVAYTLRHTSATTLTVLGMGQKLLADVLGHTNVKTTERYQHAKSADKVAAVDEAHQVGRARGNKMLQVDLPGREKSVQRSLFD